MSIPEKLSQELKYFDGDSTGTISIYADTCAPDGTSCMETYLSVTVDGVNTGYCQSSTYLGAEQASKLRYSDGVDIFAVLKSFTYPPPVAPLGIGRGVFGGGGTTPSNVIDYITINTPSNSTYFGDLLTTRYWDGANSNGTNGRGTFSGGTTQLFSVDYITIASTANAQDFGDLAGVAFYHAGTDNSTNERGIFGGGNTNGTNVINYITINSLGSGGDFGDLTQARRNLAACSNGTNERGVFGGGSTDAVNGLLVIDYVTINSIGNASSFGNLTLKRFQFSACSNRTNERGIFLGGNVPGASNRIDYITINTPSAATDFGDTQGSSYRNAACSNGTDDRGVVAEGGAIYEISYVTISSTGNAQDFGDLYSARIGLAGCADA